MKAQFFALCGVLVLLVSPLVAVADQCAYVTQQQARAAAAAVPVGRTFVHFCEPCGDKVFPAKAGVLVKGASVNALPANETGLDQDYWELQLNGEGVDLAYIYVKQANDSFINLARLAHCPTNGVWGGYDAKGRKLKLRRLPG